MKNNKLTIIASSLILMEWLEYALYMYLSISISHYFFPIEYRDSSLVFAYAIFAISYLSRPIGGMIFGVFADKSGRRKPLIISSIMVGVATAAIGMIPSYSSIGALSPFLLLMCRLLQSFAVSGEFNNASIFLIEHASRNKVLAGSWVGTASSGGMFLGAIISYLVSISDIDYAWRLAFIIIGFLSIIIALFRKQLSESPEFLMITKNSTKDNINILRTLSNHKIGIYKIFSISAFLCVYIYTCNIYFAGLMSTKLEYQASEAVLAMLIVQGVVTILIPIFALFADRFGYLKVLQICIPVIGIMVVLLFGGASIESHEIIVFSLALYIFGNSGISACIFKYMFDSLPTEVRCTGGSIAYSISVAIFGGTALIIATSFVDNGLILMPGIYVLIFAILAYVSIFYIHDEKD